MYMLVFFWLLIAGLTVIGFGLGYASGWKARQKVEEHIRRDTWQQTQNEMFTDLGGKQIRVCSHSHGLNREGRCWDCKEFVHDRSKHN